MLMHHGNEDYEVAASRAAKQARGKLDELIQKGRTRAGAVIKQVESEQPEDRIVRADAITFQSDPEGDLVAQIGKGVDLLDRFHKNALSQAAGRIGLPWSYVQTLLGPEAKGWGPDLAAHNYNELLRCHTKENTRYLLRGIRGQIRGFLSDRYRRLDSRPIVDSCLRAFKEVGALPIEGYALETKVGIKAVLPLVFEPVPHEVMAVGVYFENSDFGNGPCSLRAFGLRLVCTNYMITEQTVREIHLGGRLSEEIAWSEETYQLDTKRMAAMVSDVVKGHLAPAKIDTMMSAIRKANAEALDPAKATLLLRKYLTKGESEAATEVYNSPDVERLPPGNTMWRLSNAVSWLAGTTEDEERRIDLMKVAGTFATRTAA